MHTILLKLQYYYKALLHTGNESVKQLFYTILCSLMMGQSGQKHVEFGVL